MGSVRGGRPFQPQAREAALLTINLYDLNDYLLLNSWDISAIGVPASGYGGHNPRRSMNFAIDGVANVAYITSISERADGSGTDGLGHSYLWSVSLTTRDVACLTEISYYYPVFLGGASTIPPYPSGAALHIPLPVAPVVECNPWFPLPPIRMAQSSHPILSARMNQFGGNAAQLGSTRQ